MRPSKYGILKPIRERYSARAFLPDPVKKEDLLAMLEAASFAPSCFNEQPWRFIVADDKDNLLKMTATLTDKNQRWAGKAPLLLALLCKKNFTQGNSPNPWSRFDSGTAMGFLMVEAASRGYIVHPMGGFSAQKLRENYQVVDEYDIITVVAIGRLGTLQDLAPEFHEAEHPNPRKELSELMLPTD